MHMARLHLCLRVDRLVPIHDPRQCLKGVREGTSFTSIEEDDETSGYFISDEAAGAGERREAACNAQ